MGSEMCIRDSSKTRLEVKFVLSAMKSMKSVKKSISVRVDLDILQKNTISGLSRRVRRTSCTHLNKSRLSTAAASPAEAATGRYCSGRMILLLSSIILEKHSKNTCDRCGSLTIG